MKPIIAIIPTFSKGNYSLNSAYANAISCSGGIPIILPYSIKDTLEIINTISGFLFSGGGDIGANYLGEELNPKANDINSYRDDYEIELCKYIIDKDIPALFICRGEQILNIATGGKIVQHIENHLHTENRNLPIHKVSVYKNTLLSKITNKKEFFVNSIHHQAVLKVSDKLKISGVSPDGTIEAIEMPDMNFILGVQWHPEALFNDYPEQEAIFRYFIKKSKEYHENKNI